MPPGLRLCYDRPDSISAAGGAYALGVSIGGIDRGLGFLFGVLRGAVLVAIAFLIYERVIVSDPIPMVDDSRTAIVFAQLSEQLDEQLPQDVPGWIAQRYDELIQQSQ